MDKLPQFIEKRFGFSRQQLFYWRKVGVFKASSVTPGGHYRYTFQDLRVLKTIRLLKDAGFSTHRIRKSYAQMKKRFPEISNPLLDNQIVVFGNRIIFVHKGRAYDALTGQAFLIDFRQIDGWASEIIRLTDGVHMQRQYEFLEYEVRIDLKDVAYATIIKTE